MTSRLHLCHSSNRQKLDIFKLPHLRKLVIKLWRWCISLLSKEKENTFWFTTSGPMCSYMSLPWVGSCTYSVKYWLYHLKSSSLITCLHQRRYYNEPRTCVLNGTYWMTVSKKWSLWAVRQFNREKDCVIVHFGASATAVRSDVLIFVVVGRWLLQCGGCAALDARGREGVGEAKCAAARVEQLM